MPSDLPQEIRALPRAERTQLAHLLIRSLDDGADEDVDELWAKEIERRAADVRTGRVTCRPIDEVLERVRRKLKDAHSDPSRC